MTAAAGCASSSTPSTSAAGASSSGTGAATSSGGSAGSQSLTQVKIGKAVNTIGFTTVDVAKANGYFAKGGVDVTDEVLGGSSTAYAALQSGSVQFVTASSTSLLKARAKGLPLEAIASLDYGVSLQLIASDSWIKAHNISANEPLTSVMKKMVGAKLGEISTTDLAFDHYLEQAAGVDSSKFSYVQIKTQAAALAALQHGEIDAFLLSPPSTYYAQSQGNAKIIATLHQVPQLKNMAYDILVTDTNYAKAHPDVVKAVATAMAMADDVMSSNPSSVLGVETQHYSTMSKDVLLQSLQYVTFANNGLFTAQGWQLAKQEALDTKLKVSSVDVSQGSGVWTNKYIDTAALSSAASSS